MRRSGSNESIFLPKGVFHMKLYNVAVLGATGAVGREMIKVLEERNFPIAELRALASEDWLEIKNGVGAYVKPLSSKDIRDLYEVRCLLEVQAAKTAVSKPNVRSTKFKSLSMVLGMPITEIG